MLWRTAKLHLPSHPLSNQSPPSGGSGGGSEGEESGYINTFEDIGVFTSDYTTLIYSNTFEDLGLFPSDFDSLIYSNTFEEDSV
jgi:hypothetical protein